MSSTHVFAVVGPERIDVASGTGTVIAAGRNVPLRDGHSILPLTASPRRPTFVATLWGSLTTSQLSKIHHIRGRSVSTWGGTFVCV